MMYEQIDYQFRYEMLTDKHRRLREALDSVHLDLHYLQITMKDKIDRPSGISEELILEGVYDFECDINGQSFGYNHILINMVSDYVYELMDSCRYYLPKHIEFETPYDFLSCYLDNLNWLNQINEAIKGVVLPLVRILEDNLSIYDGDYSMVYAELLDIQKSLNKYSKEYERVKSIEQEIDETDDVVKTGDLE